MSTTKTKSKLKKSIARRWVKALLSGDYSQVGGGLRDVNEHGGVDGYCCLGVLCDVSKLGWWEDEYYHANGEFHSGFLPESISDLVNLSDEQQEELARLNDSGKSFRYIASRICKMAGIEMPAAKKKAPAKAVRK